jgi:hypothetical protein
VRFPESAFEKESDAAGGRRWRSVMLKFRVADEVPATPVVALPYGRTAERSRSESGVSMNSERRLGESPEGRKTIFNTEAEIDDLQDDLMAASSDDGRPVAKAVRAREWMWFAIGAVGVSVVSVVWALATGASWGAVFVAVLLGSFFIAFASPAVVVGLLRAKEERAAKVGAEGPVEPR